MVDARRVRQAREWNGFTQTDLAARVEASQGLIAQIEGGFKTASDELLERISAQTHFPVAFFHKAPAIEFPPESLMFRERSDTTRTEENQGRRQAEIVCELGLHLIGDVPPIPLKLPAPIKEPVKAARALRVALGLPTHDPIPHLVRSLERAGVLFLALPIDLPKTDEFTLWIGDEEKRPIIAFAKGRPGDRLRMSIAHAVGHLGLGHSGILHQQEEREAYQFAAELLMPEETMRKEIPTPVTLSGLASLKARWRVAIQALVRRAYDLTIITERQYRYLFAQLSMKGWRRKEPIPIAPEKPRLLSQLAERLYGVPINHEKLAQETSLSQRLVKEILDCYECGRAAISDNIPTSTKVVVLNRSRRIREGV